MSLFTRSLRRCGQDVELQKRVEKIVNGMSREIFTTIGTVKAIIKTPNGISVFDDTNTERSVSHELCIAFRADVTAETWVNVKNKRLKVLSTVNCCEKDQSLRLMCTERGDESRVINSA